MIRFSPCPNCCRHCRCCLQTPPRLAVTIAGLASGPETLCTDCERLAGTFVVERAAGASADNCVWRYTLSPPACGADKLEAEIGCDAQQSWIVVRWRSTLGGAASWTWQRLYPSMQLDCTALDDEELDRWAGFDGLWCLDQEATCRVTALTAAAAVAAANDVAVGKGSTSLSVELAARLDSKRRLGLCRVKAAEVERRLALCRGCAEWSGLCRRDAGGCTALERYVRRLTQGDCPLWQPQPGDEGRRAVASS